MLQQDTILPEYNDLDAHSSLQRGLFSAGVMPDFVTHCQRDYSANPSVLLSSVALQHMSWAATHFHKMPSWELVERLTWDDARHTSSSTSSSWIVNWLTTTCIGGMPMRLSYKNARQQHHAEFGSKQTGKLAQPLLDSQLIAPPESEASCTATHDVLSFRNRTALLGHAISSSNQECPATLGSSRRSSMQSRFSCSSSLCSLHSHAAQPGRQA